MLKLVITVVAIALPDCINPSLIAGELFVATGPRPRRRTAAFTLGAFTVTFVFGLVLALGLGDLILSLLPKPSVTLKYALITSAGLVLVIGGTVIWIRRNALASSEPPHHQRKSHGSAALMGAGIGGLEVLTAFPYFAAITMIIGSGVSNPAKLSLLVLYCVVYALPLIAIAVVFAVKGEPAEDLLRPASTWLSARWAVVLGPVTATVGIGVLVFGIVQLASV